MPFWSKPHKVRRSTHILSFAVQQNWTLLNHGGEACFLLQRLRRASDNFQVANRRVDYIDKTLTTPDYDLDPDTGLYRAKLWGTSTDPANTFPDIGNLVCTVQAGSSSTVWEAAVDKYSFVAGENEYAFDIFRNQLQSDGTPIDDAVYMVFNTPPFDAADSVRLKFGNINPAVLFEAMQPDVDNQPGFQNSLYSFKQWINEDARIRGLLTPNRFLLAFPGVLSDFTITEGGLLRQSASDFWTTPSPYSPTIQEHDVVVREATEQRFQVVNYTPIYVEDILVSQHFDMAELGPESSIYNVEVEGWEMKP